MTSSYAVAPSALVGSAEYHDTDPSTSFDYYSDDENSGVWSKAAGAALGWGIAGTVVAVVAGIIIVAVVIAIIVEVKKLSSAVTIVKNRSLGGWLENWADSFNEVDTDAIVNRMFPGGFSEVVQTIEQAYKLYRGYDKQDNLKPAKRKTTAL